MKSQVPLNIGALNLCLDGEAINDPIRDGAPDGRPRVEYVARRNVIRLSTDPSWAPAYKSFHYQIHPTAEIPVVVLDTTEQIRVGFAPGLTSDYNAFQWLTAADSRYWLEKDPARKRELAVRLISVWGGLDSLGEQLKTNFKERGSTLRDDPTPVLMKTTWVWRFTRQMVRMKWEGGSFVGKILRVYFYRPDDMKLGEHTSQSKYVQLEGMDANGIVLNEVFLIQELQTSVKIELAGDRRTWEQLYSS